MDSLTSSSGSERQLSFSTFGKSAAVEDHRNRLNESKSGGGGIEEMKPSLVLIENDASPQSDAGSLITVDSSTTIAKKTVESAAAAAAAKQNDSTDEDSGIESIMRISKENIIVAPTTTVSGAQPVDGQKPIF